MQARLRAALIPEDALLDVLVQAGMPSPRSLFVPWAPWAPCPRDAGEPLQEVVPMDDLCRGAILHTKTNLHALDMVCSACGWRAVLRQVVLEEEPLQVPGGLHRHSHDRPWPGYLRQRPQATTATGSSCGQVSSGRPLAMAGMGDQFAAMGDQCGGDGRHCAVTVANANDGRRYALARYNQRRWA